MHLKALRFGAALLVSVALHGCGGSGSDTDAIEGSGVTQNVTNIGAITGIAGSGEITVNGDTVGLSGASIDIDGDAVTAAELKVGHVVTVRAPYDAGATIVAASAVSADILVAGRIEGLDIAANRITILGQLVEIDAGTVIEGLVEGEPFGGLTVGSDVEVSGFTDSQGVIFARHIEARRSATPLVVTGAVSGLDTANKRMSINGKEVDYADATLTGFGSVSLDGATVQVNGDVLSGEGELHATEVVYQDKRVPGNVDDEVRLEGWVTRFASPTDFDVDGHPVTTTPATQTNGPMDDTIGIVRLDAFVSIKGKLIADGVIEAYEITTNNIIDINASITRFDSTRLEASGRFANHTCDLDGAVIEVDDVPADWHALHVGDIVTIHELFDWQSLRPEPPEGWPRPTRDPVCKIVTVQSQPAWNGRLRQRKLRLARRDGTEGLDRAVQHRHGNRHRRRARRSHESAAGRYRRGQRSNDGAGRHRREQRDTRPGGARLSNREPCAKRRHLAEAADLRHDRGRLLRGRARRFSLGAARGARQGHRDRRCGPGGRADAREGTEVRSQSVERRVPQPAVRQRPDHALRNADETSTSKAGVRYRCRILRSPTTTSDRSCATRH